MSVDLTKLDQALKAKGAGIQQAGSDTTPSLSDYKCLIVRARGPGIQTPGSPAKNCNPQDWGLFTAPQENPIFGATSSSIEADILGFSLQVNEGDNRKIELLGFNPYDNGSCASWSQRVLPGRFDTLIREVNVLAEAGPFSVFASQAVELTAVAPSEPQHSQCGSYLAPMNPDLGSGVRRISQASPIIHFWCSDRANTASLTFAGVNDTQTCGTEGTAQVTLSNIGAASDGFGNLRIEHMGFSREFSILKDLSPPSAGSDISMTPELYPGEGPGMQIRFKIEDPTSALVLGALPGESLSQWLVLSQIDGAPSDPECFKRLMQDGAENEGKTRWFKAFIGACRNPGALGSSYKLSVNAGLVKDGGTIDESRIPSPSFDLSTAFQITHHLSVTPPTGIQAIASNAKVTLSWTPVPNAFGYRVRYASSAEALNQTGQFQELEFPGPYQNVIADLTNGQSYYFAVQTLFAASPGWATSSLSPPIGPRIPTALVFSIANSSQCLNWDQSSASYPLTLVSPSPPPTGASLTYSLAPGTPPDVTLTTSGNALSVGVPQAWGPFAPVQGIIQGTLQGTLNLENSLNTSSTQTLTIGRMGHPLITSVGNSYNFGSLTSGSAPSERTIILAADIRNCKPEAVNFGSLSGPFSRVTTTETLDCGNTSTFPNGLPAGQSCTVKIKFDPAGQAIGPYTSNLTTTSSNIPLTITLSGEIVATAPPAFATTFNINPSSLKAFEKSELSFGVTVTGPAGFVLSQNLSDFVEPVFASGSLTPCTPTVTALTCQMATCSFTVEFDPSQCGINSSNFIEPLKIKVRPQAFKATQATTQHLSPEAMSPPIQLIKRPQLEIAGLDVNQRRVGIKISSMASLPGVSYELVAQQNEQAPSTTTVTPSNSFQELGFTDPFGLSRPHRLKYTLNYKVDGMLSCGTSSHDCPIQELIVPLKTAATQLGASPVYADGANYNSTLTPHPGHTCMLAEGGMRIKCFGAGTLGQQGNNTVELNRQPTLVSFPSTETTGFTQVVVGETFNCALTRSGKRYCWGRNDLGQLGLSEQGESPEIRHLLPQLAADIDHQNVPIRYTALSAGHSHACGIDTRGRLWCWGNLPSTVNGSNQLQITRRPREIKLSDTDTQPWVAISTGGTRSYPFSCAIKKTNTSSWTTFLSSLYCWGDNTTGQLGIQSTPATYSGPSIYTGVFNPISVSTGSRHACGIDSTSNLYCWGSRAEFQTGINYSPGSPGNWFDPQQLFIGYSVEAVSAGHTHSCAILKNYDDDDVNRINNTLHCWGTQTNTGVLGLGPSSPNTLYYQSSTQTNSWAGFRAATQIYSPLSDFTPQGLATGGSHTCALSRDGTQAITRCWGRNDTAQLGQTESSQAVFTPNFVTSEAPAP